MRRFPKWQRGLAIVFMVACADHDADPTAPNDVPVSFEEGIGGVFSPPNIWKEPVTVNGVTEYRWHPVQVVSSSSNPYRTEAVNAVMSWNSVLMGGLSFTTSPSSDDIAVNVSGSGSGNYFCGQNGGRGGNITLTQVSSLSSSCGIGGGTVDRAYAVALHEAGRAVGFSQFNVADEHLNACVMYIPPEGSNDGNLNDSFCAHEEEAIKAYFGERAQDPNMTRLLVASANPHGPTTVLVGQSITLNASPVCDQSSSHTYTSCPPPASGYSWSENDADISMSGSGSSRTITGLSAGTAVVSVTPRQGADVVSDASGGTITITVVQPLTASIQGRSSIPPKDSQCMYYAVVQGGTQPYTIVWDAKNGNVLQQTGPSTGFYAFEGTANIKFTVTDGAGAVLTRSMTVEVTRTASVPPC